MTRRAPTMTTPTRTRRFDADPATMPREVVHPCRYPYPSDPDARTARTGPDGRPCTVPHVTPFVGRDGTPYFGLYVHGRRVSAHPTMAAGIMALEGYTTR